MPTPCHMCCCRICHPSLRVMYLLLPFYIGLQLPIVCRSQSPSDHRWDHPRAPISSDLKGSHLTTVFLMSKIIPAVTGLWNEFAHHSTHWTSEKSQNIPWISMGHRWPFHWLDTWFPNIWWPFIVLWYFMICYELWISYPAIHRGGWKMSFSAELGPRSSSSCRRNGPRSKLWTLDSRCFEDLKIKVKRQVFQHQKTGVNQSKQIN